jgi:acylaminoacyl-peptidase
MEDSLANSLKIIDDGASSQLNKKSRLLALWRFVSALPQVKSGSLDCEFPCDGCQITFEVPEIESNSKCLFARHFYRTNRQSEFRGSACRIIDGKVDFFTRSPSKKIGVVQKSVSGEDSVMQVWRADTVLSTIAVRKLHGAVVASPYFQHVAWTEDEGSFVYVAEKFVKPPSKLWEADGCNELDAAQPFQHRETFGEGMSGHAFLSLFLCNIKERNIVEVLPEAFSKEFMAVEPELTDDRTIWFSARRYYPQRLGLTHCATRPMGLYSVTLGGGVEEKKSLTEGIPIHRNMRRRGDRMVFLSPSPGYLGHNCCHSLHVCSMTEGTSRTLVPLVPFPGADPFPGLYPTCGNDLHWIDDDHVLVSSYRRSSAVLYVVNVHDGMLQQIECTKHPGTWTVLEARGPTLLLSHSTAVQPPSVFLLEDCLRPEPPCTVYAPFLPVALRDAFKTEIIHVPEAHDTEILFHHRDHATSRPLVLFLHGGPNSVDSNFFGHGTYFHLLCGFNVASVNYGGSLGFGQKRVDELLHHIGTNDVADCIAAYNRLAELPSVDKHRVICSGGSHGGFLTAHLTSRYPHLFHVAWLRNPVINIAGMIDGTDIPDWCEAFAAQRSDAQRMYDMSPLQFAGEVAAATLIGIGQDDLRVPPSQGRAWFYGIRRSRPDCNAILLEYGHNSHPMDTPHAMADFHIQGALLASNVFGE